jgi:hypothetical protein
VSGSTGSGADGAGHTDGDVPRMIRELLRVHCEPPQPPANAADIADLQARARELDRGLPPEYLDLLRDQNGGEVNGLRFFGTRPAPLVGAPEVVLPGLVDVNRDLREGGGLDEHVVMAQGSSALFALHSPSGRFHELSVVPRDVIGEHATFAALMAAAVAAHA